MCTGKRHKTGVLRWGAILWSDRSQPRREEVSGLQVRAAPSCKQVSPQPQSQHSDSFGLHLPQDIIELSQRSEGSHSTQSRACQAHHPAKDTTKQCLLEGLMPAKPCRAQEDYGGPCWQHQQLPDIQQIGSVGRNTKVWNKRKQLSGMSMSARRSTDSGHSKRHSMLSDHRGIKLKTENRMIIGKPLTTWLKETHKHTHSFKNQ